MIDPQTQMNGDIFIDDWSIFIYSHAMALFIDGWRHQSNHGLVGCQHCISIPLNSLNFLG